ncbi:hypothetical protein CEUSTIGMA_g1896.t1 [Chlamydomonas eustigma]|uniref:Uncharacterized protein n=1 Tax=Chlamydomonas eustigma TaxID=1157962 RepID=A0A250WUE2_9CHLO|nr:hypothetical protein CEUSTIGMA_g1896.t1 [Chlamydomonas eustigma]|eukprot:GAX74447.1 hypothetical protein CEUSTIGMA_g1896.t1 [Chlamydomonas eustigma]
MNLLVKPALSGLLNPISHQCHHAWDIVSTIKHFYNMHSISSERFSNTPSMARDFVPGFSFMTRTLHQSQQLSSMPLPTTSSAPTSFLYTDVPPVVMSPKPCRVVVIGWMGSRARYLRKYTGLWERTGEHAVISIRPTVAQTLLRFKGVVQAGADIDKVARLHIENGNMPTFYHIFSTGGFIHAGTMWRWMDEVEDVMLRRDLLEDVAGIIIDSGPAKVTPQLAARAVVSAFSSIPAEQWASAGSASSASSLPASSSSSPTSSPSSSALVLQPMEALFRFWLATKGPRLREEEVLDAWFHRAPTCPQLYLYSDADPLANPKEIEEYMSTQESRGVDVSKFIFSGSGHCQHYKQYPHEYAFQVSQFVNQCLAAGW